MAVTSWSTRRDWHVLQHERGAGKERILSKQISERNLVRTHARHNDSILRDTVWIVRGNEIIKRVKESVISGESSFEAYMQTRIRKRRNRTRFDINSDTRIDEIHEPVSITELHVVQDRNRKGHRRASRKRAGLSIHGENKQVNK
jgi:hypothetical protein